MAGLEDGQMIVACVYCGPLPLEDLERWRERAWAKHVHEQHPEWPPGVAEHTWPPEEGTGR